MGVCNLCRSSLPVKFIVPCGHSICFQCQKVNAEECPQFLNCLVCSTLNSSDSTSDFHSSSVCASMFYFDFASLRLFILLNESTLQCKACSGQCIAKNVKSFCYQCGILCHPCTINHNVAYKHVNDIVLLSEDFINPMRTADDPYYQIKSFLTHSITQLSNNIKTMMIGRFLEEKNWGENVSYNWAMDVKNELDIIWFGQSTLPQLSLPIYNIEKEIFKNQSYLNYIREQLSVADYFKPVIYQVLSLQSFVQSLTSVSHSAYNVIQSQLQSILQSNTSTGTLNTSIKKWHSTSVLESSGYMSDLTMMSFHEEDSNSLPLLGPFLDAFKDLSLELSHHHSMNEAADLPTDDMSSLMEHQEKIFSQFSIEIPIMDGLCNQRLSAKYQYLNSKKIIIMDAKKQIDHCQVVAFNVLLDAEKRKQFDKIARTLEQLLEEQRFKMIPPIMNHPNNTSHLHLGQGIHFTNKALNSQQGMMSSTLLLSSSKKKANKSQSGNVMAIPRRGIAYKCKLSANTCNTGPLEEVNGICSLQAVQGSVTVTYLLTTDTNAHNIKVRNFPSNQIIYEVRISTSIGQPAYPVSISVKQEMSSNIFNSTPKWSLKTESSEHEEALLPDLFVGVRKPHNRVLRLTNFRQLTPGGSTAPGKGKWSVLECDVSQEYGRGYLEHLKCSVLDNFGNVLVLENKIMRVSVFEIFSGQILSVFTAGNLQFPIDFTVDYCNRIHIADNRNDCVLVYNYNGENLGKIGGFGLTNHCGAICRMPDGRIVILDNHNSFNITLFDENGLLVEAFHSHHKHAQILSACPLPNGLVACSSRDFQLYVFDINEHSSVNYPNMGKPRSPVNG